MRGYIKIEERAHERRNRDTIVCVVCSYALCSTFLRLCSVYSLLLCFFFARSKINL